MYAREMKVHAQYCELAMSAAGAMGFGGLDHALQMVNTYLRYCSTNTQPNLPRTMCQTQA